MAKDDLSSSPPILSPKKAMSRGLTPLTIAEFLDTPLRIGDGKSRVRYIDWLIAEQQRITRFGDRKAEIVDEGEGRVSLWVDNVAS